MATFEEQSDQISLLVDDMQTQALALKDDTLTAINDISAALQTMLDAVELVEYVPGTSGITFNYSAPSDATEPDLSAVGPSAVSVPSATDVAIGDTEWDQINAVAAADLALIGVGEEAAAADEAGWRGLAVPAVVSAALVSEAEQRTMDRISSGRLTSVVEQAKAAREDIKDLTGLDVQNYTAQWQGIQTYTAAESQKLNARVALMQAQIQSLGENRGWKEADVQRLLEQANRTAQYILERTRLVEQKSVEVNTNIAQLMAGVTQAFLTAVDAGMRSTVGINLTGDA